MKPQVEPQMNAEMRRQERLPLVIGVHPHLAFRGQSRGFGTDLQIPTAVGRNRVTFPMRPKRKKPSAPKPLTNVNEETCVENESGEPKPGDDPRIQPEPRP
jgi:hypothetical protein